MSTTLTDRLQPVLETAAAHAAAVDAEYRFPRESIDALVDAGLLGLTVAESEGGLGASPWEFSTVVSALAERCGSTAMVYLMHVCAVMTVASAPPPGDPKLVDAMSRDRLGTLAFSETGSRSHFWAPVSVLEGEGEDLRLVARKSFVTSARDADVIVASTGAPAGVELYAVPADRAGLDVRGGWRGMGLRGNDSAPIDMNVPVTQEDRIGGPGSGFDTMMGTVLPWFNLGNASVSLGLARGALNSAVQHACRARIEHLDITLAEMPTVRARLARMQVACAALAATIERTAGALAAPDEATPLAVLTVKALGNETALSVTDEAMRVCGGAAFAASLGTERFFRDARAGVVMAPTSDVLHDFIGKAITGQPLF